MLIKDVNELKQKFDDFAKTKSGNSISIPFSLLKEYYSPAKWLDVVKKLVQITVQFIFPSKQQRFKYSPLINQHIDFSSTWSSSHSNLAILSWITDTIKPVVNINLYSWIKLKMAGMWDGESKTLILIDWFKNKKVFQVLNKNGKFVKEIEDFINYSEKWRSNTKELKEVFYLFQEEFQTTKEQYLTPKWLESKGFKKIVQTALDMEVTVVLDFLSESQETNAYQIKGECFKPQVASNLAMAKFKPTMEEDLFYEGILSKPLSWKELISNSFYSIPNQDFLYKEVTKAIYEGESYGEKDVYLPILFLSHFVDGSSGQFNFSFPVTPRIEDNAFLKIMCRPTADGDREGFDSVERMCILYQRTKESIDHKQKVAECAKILKYSSKFDSICLKDEYKKIIEENHSNNNASVPKGNQGNGVKLRIIHSSNIFNLIKYFTIGYVYTTPNLNENHIEKVYAKILATFNNQWIEYCKSKDSLKRIPQEKIQEAFDNIDNKNPEENLVNITVYAKLALEFIGKAAIDFYELFVKDGLNVEFANDVSRETERKLFIYHLQQSKIKPEEYEILNPHGEVTTLKTMQVGHPVPESEGGQLRRKEWLVENVVRGNDDGKYKYAIKDVKLYYICCINKIENALEKFRNTPFDDMVLYKDITFAINQLKQDNELSPEQLELRNEYNQLMYRKMCLEVTCKHFEIEYKPDFTLDENAYILKYGK